MTFTVNCRGRITDNGWAIAKVWNSEGVATKEIARRLNVAPSTVRYNLERCTPSGRPSRNPPKLTAKAKKAISSRRDLVMAYAKKTTVFVGSGGKSGRAGKRIKKKRDFPSCQKIADQLRREHNIKVCRNTVRNDLGAVGLTAKRRPRGPTHYVGDAERRVAFAKKHLHDNPSRIFFSDEKYCDTNDNGCGWQWCEEGEKPDHRGFDRWAPKLHVWGCIGVGYRRLAFLSGDGTVDSDMYETLCIKPNKKLLSKRGYVFMQDGAAAHRSKATMESLRKKGINVMSDWPPRSPDLNPIEQLWSRIARVVSDLGPVEEGGLQVAVKKAWEAIPEKEIDKLVMSFTNKLKKCIELKGAIVR